MPEGDPSTLDQRSEQVHVAYRSPDGLRVSKETETPVIGVTPSGWADPARVVWTIDAANIAATGAPPRIGDLDLIDVLPESGTGQSQFDGPGSFVRAEVTQGTGITILYTARPKSALVNNPDDATNAQDGTTVWCSAASGGVVVMGAGTASDCPTAARDVTAIRMLRPGDFTQSDLFQVRLETVADLNLDGNDMRNSVMASATGPAGKRVTLTANPAVATFIRADRFGSVGADVWLDANRNGVRDDGEGVLPGATVLLTDPANPGRDPLTAVTDADGRVRFDGVPVGSYTIVFAPRTGMEQTTPASVGATVTAGATAQVQGAYVLPVVAPAAPVDQVRATPAPAPSVPTPAPATSVLRIRIVPSRSRLTSGQRVTYRITVGNTSATAATRVSVCDPIPGGLVVVRVNGGTVVRGRVCWSLGTLAAGRSRTVTLVARVVTTRHRALRNTATASAANAARRATAATTAHVRARVVVPPPRVTG